MNGNVSNINDMAQKIGESLYGWHLKALEGFGHVIHNWFACGRPPILRGSQHVGKPAGDLVEDGVTCIDLDKRSYGDNLAYIRKMAEPERHTNLCWRAYKRFKNCVDYDADAAKIKKFFEEIP
jgi:hypothetical protein